MTRLNLVPTSELMDQHLFAEFREIKMVPRSLERTLQACWRIEFARTDSGYRREPVVLESVKKKIPSEYTLGKGHVSFFYDKGKYLRRRYEELRAELRRRGINFDASAALDSHLVFLGLPQAFSQDYEPTSDALVIVRSRISERIAKRPDWYRYYGKPR